MNEYGQGIRWTSESAEYAVPSDCEDNTDICLAYLKIHFSSTASPANVDGNMTMAINSAFLVHPGAQFFQLFILRHVLLLVYGLGLLHVMERQLLAARMA